MRLHCRYCGTPMAASDSWHGYCPSCTYRLMDALREWIDRHPDIREEMLRSAGELILDAARDPSALTVRELTVLSATSRELAAHGYIAPQEAELVAELVRPHLQDG